MRRWSKVIVVMRICWLGIIFVIVWMPKEREESRLNLSFLGLNE